MKITTQQKAIIKLMRRGGQLSRFRQKHKMIASLAPWVILGDERIKTNLNTVENLMKLGLIETHQTPSTNWLFPETYYKLTDLGKTITI